MRPNYLEDLFNLQRYLSQTWWKGPLSSTVSELSGVLSSFANPRFVISRYRAFSLVNTVPNNRSSLKVRLDMKAGLFHKQTNFTLISCRWLPTFLGRAIVLTLVVLLAGRGNTQYHILTSA